MMRSYISRRAYKPREAYKQYCNFIVDEDRIFYIVNVSIHLCTHVLPPHRESQKVDITLKFTYFISSLLPFIYDASTYSFDLSARLRVSGIPGAKYQASGRR